MEHFYFWLALFVLYWLPSIIGVAHKSLNAASVLVINAFLGWTFIGWVIALAMAARHTRR